MTGTLTPIEHQPKVLTHEELLQENARLKLKVRNQRTALRSLNRAYIVLRYRSNKAAMDGIVAGVTAAQRLAEQQRGRGE